jgi:hypothetical protein
LSTPTPSQSCAGTSSSRGRARGRPGPATQLSSPSGCNVDRMTILRHIWHTQARHLDGLSCETYMQYILTHAWYQKGILTNLWQRPRLESRRNGSHIRTLNLRYVHRL